MRIPSGTTDQYIYFVAVDATDLKTRETGLSSFTVYRSRDGAAPAAMTTPTVNETDGTNMPGVYELLLDEDMTIGSGNDSEEMVFHITCSGMAPVTRVIELYRPKITAGYTLSVESDGDLTKVNTLDGNTAQTGDSFARIGATGSGLTSLATQTSVNTIDDFLDTEIASLTTELAKVPKEDGSKTFNATCVGNIKSGLTTTAMLPTNFVDLAITASTGRVTVGTNADKTGYSLAADQSSVTVGTVTNVGTVTGNVNGSVGSVTGAVGSVTGAVGSVTGAVGSVSGNVGGSVASVTAGVTLANGAHGGAATTITAKSIAVTNSDAGGVAVTLTGSGTGNSHALRLASTNGSSISATAGSHAITVNSSAGDGIQITGATNDINADITGTLATCTTVTNMLTAAAVNAEVDTALNTAIPASGATTVGSINDYIRRTKYAMCNRWDIVEASGNLEIFDDSNASFTTVAAAFTTLAGVTLRKKVL